MSKKIRSYTWHRLFYNYDSIRYFYRLSHSDYRSETPIYNIFILDNDGFVYEIFLKCFENEIEKLLINFLENNLL